MFLLNPVDSQHPIPVLQVDTRTVHLWCETAVSSRAVPRRADLESCKEKTAHSYRSAVLGPEDCRRRNPKGVTAKSEWLLQGDREVERLAVILNLRGN